MHPAVEMNVIDFVDGRLHAVQERSVQRGQACAPADHGRFRGAAEFLHQAADLACGIRVEARDGGARPVEDRQLCPFPHSFGKILVAQTGNELSQDARCIGRVGGIFSGRFRACCSEIGRRIHLRSY